ncbi:MAG: phytanoyl-CoA dioxygenase family protein [Byssovorax sp.]
MSRVFAAADPDARAFFAEHGYVILAPQLSADERATLRRSLASLWAAYAAEQALSIEAYLHRISQWRDLWRHAPAFEAVLGDPRLASTAAQLMGYGGARLLHDHVIAKPARASDSIPWHQDYPYWPVDTEEGLSCWCPLDDVGEEGGCLEVIDGSHRWGESPPADFLLDDQRALSERADRVRLPVKAGSIVVLQSLTWHRSGPNHDAGDRAAYISLWLPPDARYAPEHSGWHPVNEHVSVQPGEILNDDWFPCFGSHDARARGPRVATVAGRAPREGLSMFNASAKIASQIRAILARSGRSAPPGGGIGRLLGEGDTVTSIVDETVASGVAGPGDERRLREALEQLRIAGEAYRLHRARDVYNGAYAAWWRLAGAAWETRLGRERA